LTSKNVFVEQPKLFSLAGLHLLAQQLRHRRSVESLSGEAQLLSDEDGGHGRGELVALPVVFEKSDGFAVRYQRHGVLEAALRRRVGEGHQGRQQQGGEGKPHFSGAAAQVSGRLSPLPPRTG
jgi:hypothetical protein